ncbi:MAG: FAD-dependent oxidoreductase [Alphaproteobacteria bacterium]
MGIPTSAGAVVIGGGIVGCSTAYHLAKRGVSGVILIERQKLTSGTTWHAAGLIGQLRPTLNWTRLARYGTELFRSLETETGQSTGYQQIGSIRLATQAPREEEFRRASAKAHSIGLPNQLLTPEEISERWPLINVDDVVLGLWLPEDGKANPTDTTMAFAKGARALGAKLYEGICAVGLAPGKDHLTVRTDQGEIKAEFVFNCTGMWGRETGRAWTATPVPLHACEHYYVVTDSIDGLPSDFPVVRDVDNALYFKEDAGKMLFGATELRAKPWGMEGIPNDFCFDEIPPDYDHFLPSIANAGNRMPVINTVGLQTVFNGPESFTPDQKMQLGPVPGFKNYFVAAGMNTVGIQASAAIGRLLSEWVVDGVASLDVSDSLVSRNLPFQAGQQFLYDRSIETVGVFNDIHWPYKQLKSARGARRSPFHQMLSDNHAFFGDTMGWERPLWFAPSAKKVCVDYSFGRQNWFEYSAAEHNAVRNDVGLMDYSPFAKYELRGRDATRVLQRICTANVDIDVDSVVYTTWLNQAGGIESDLTVVRTGQESYLILASSANQAKDFHWLNDHIPDGACAVATDITSGLAGLALMGPRSRDILTAFTGADLSNETFPFSTSRTIDFGYAMARAVRVSYAGELGWELYFPTEFAGHIVERVAAWRSEFDLRLVGLQAVDSLRIEKFFKHGGHDISTDETPLNAGMMFTVDLDKPGGFIGREALLRQRSEGVSRRIVQFLLPPEATFAYHDEPILFDGRHVGNITSGSYGHTLGGWVCLGYFENSDRGPVTQDLLESGRIEIDIAGTRWPVSKASLRALYDPSGSRLRS